MELIDADADAAAATQCGQSYLYSGIASSAGDCSDGPQQSTPGPHGLKHITTAN